MINRNWSSITLAAVVFAVSPTVSAEDNYFGGNLAFIEYSEDGVSDDASLTALYGRVGTHFNENFSGEIRAGMGVGDDSVDVLGFDVDVELEHFFGAYLRGGFQAGPALYPYAILGYTRGEVKASVGGFSDTLTESDMSYGVGADFSINDSTIVNLEYLSYLDKDEAEISGFTIGLAKKF